MCTKDSLIPLNPGLPAREQIRVRMLALGWELKPWAEERGYLPSEVSMMLARSRAYPAIRDDIAKTLGMSREEFDALLPLPDAA